MLKLFLATTRANCFSQSSAVTTLNIAGAASLDDAPPAPPFGAAPVEARAWSRATLRAASVAAFCDDSANRFFISAATAVWRCTHWAFGLHFATNGLDSGDSFTM